MGQLTEIWQWILNKLRWLRKHPEITWSGAGIYAVSLIVAAGIAVASWLFWPEESPSPLQYNSVVIKDNPQSGPTAIAQGTNATVNQTNNYYRGVSLEDFTRYAGDLAVTDAALANFFRILGEQQVPRSDLDAKLREIAAQQKELLHEVEAVQSTDPEVVKLKSEVKRAIEEGRYSNVEKLLKNIKERPLETLFDMYIKDHGP